MTILFINIQSNHHPTQYRVNIYHRVYACRLKMFD